MKQNKKIQKLIKRYNVDIPHGEVYVIKERCKGCRYCIEFCPEQVLKESEELNSKGYHPPMLIETEDNKCIGCGFCTLICPEFAIYSKKKNEKE